MRFGGTIRLTYGTKRVPDYVVGNWKRLNPGFDVELYDDDECLDFLRSSYGEEHARLFAGIADGPIKADFWRVCALYRRGGVYSDVDVEPLVPIDEFAEDDVEFLTCLSHYSNEVNPHLIATRPGHVVLERCLDRYLSMYRDQVKYGYWEWSLASLMRDALRGALGGELGSEGVHTDRSGSRYQFLQEVMPPRYTLFGIGFFNSRRHTHYCKYRGRRILNNRYRSYDGHRFVAGAAG
jgi:hypothetical protein